MRVIAGSARRLLLKTLDGLDTRPTTDLSLIHILRANLKTGVTYVFRGRVVKKRGRMVMEQPEVFTPDSYQALAGSMQPDVYKRQGYNLFCC